MPYQEALVDRRTQTQRSAAFLAMNPNGLIPVLETPHGPMYETGAILLWLADRHRTLLPEIDDPQRGAALQWLFWLSNTLHPTLRMLFYPRQFGAARDLTQTRLTTQLDLLAAASTAPWLDASAPSAQACYLAPMLRWPALYGGDTDWFDLGRWPRLEAFARRCEKRPAAVRAAKAEGLGPTPFSAPHPCNPPFGSAT